MSTSTNIWPRGIRTAKTCGTNASLIERKMCEVAREWIDQQIYEEWFPEDEVYDVEYWNRCSSNYHCCASCGSLVSTTLVTAVLLLSNVRS